MKRSLVLIGIIATVILSACATSRALQTSEHAPSVAPSIGMPQAAGGSSGALPQDSFAQANKAVGGGGPVLEIPGAPAAAPAAAPTGSPLDETGRLVIQNAQLSIVVTDVNARVKAIGDMAKAMGGFIVSINAYQTYANDGTQVPQAEIVVRVPQDKIDEALTQIKANTVDVQNETRTGTDVTDQYVDLQSRLTAKQAAQDQLMKIMQNATRTQDVLDVYAQLQQVESDIEVLKGQIKYYEQSAALSAISVNIIAEKTIKPIEVGGWKPQGVARDALQQLIFFWQGFINFLLQFFIFILPMILTLAIPLFLIFLAVRWLVRLLRKPKAVVPVDTQK